jgi:hypothetical protein
MRMRLLERDREKTQEHSALDVIALLYTRCPRSMA